MSSELDIINKIKDVSSAILKKDIIKVKGFSKRQTQAIAKQTIIIHKGILTGEIDEELKEFFFKGLEAMVVNFVNTLKGILKVIAEKIINAISTMLWDFLKL